MHGWDRPKNRPFQPGNLAHLLLPIPQLAPTPSRPAPTSSRPPLAGFPTRPAGSPRTLIGGAQLPPDRRQCTLCWGCAALTRGRPGAQVPSQGPFSGPASFFFFSAGRFLAEGISVEYPSSQPGPNPGYWVHRQRYYAQIFS